MIDMLYAPFKHWADGGSVWILGDTHFDDVDCKYMDPLWPSPEDHIADLNKMVYKCDTLVILGDVGNKEYVRRLNGHLVLIMGNHDRGRTKYEDVFDEVYEGPVFVAPQLLLSHEPIAGLEWCMNIHGHDHGEVFPKDDRHINLASNSLGHKPVNLGKLIKQGVFSGIPSIHRVCIDDAAERKVLREEKEHREYIRSIVKE